MTDPNTSTAHPTRDQAGGSSAAPEGTALTDHGQAAQMLEAQARDAIIKAGGRPELLMPHVIGKLGWRKDNDAIVVFSATREGDAASQSVVEQLQQDPAFAPAFTAGVNASPPAAGNQGAYQDDPSPELSPDTPTKPSPDTPTYSPIPSSAAKQGSGASGSQSFTPAFVDASDPLAVGYALKDIASGSTRVRFGA